MSVFVLIAIDTSFISLGMLGSENPPTSPDLNDVYFNIIYRRRYRALGSSTRRDNLLFGSAGPKEAKPYFSSKS